MLRKLSIKAQKIEFVDHSFVLHPT